MSVEKLTVMAISGCAGVIFTQIFGEWNDFILALLILMAIDFIMGLIVAGLFRKSTKTISGGLSSKECVKGIAKKVCEFLLVAAAYQGDRLLGVDYARAFVISGLSPPKLSQLWKTQVLWKFFRQLCRKFSKELLMN